MFIVKLMCLGKIRLEALLVLQRVPFLRVPQKKMSWARTPLEDWLVLLAEEFRERQNRMLASLVMCLVEIMLVVLRGEVQKY